MSSGYSSKCVPTRTVYFQQPTARPRRKAWRFLGEGSVAAAAITAVAAAAAAATEADGERKGGRLARPNAEVAATKNKSKQMLLCVISLPPSHTEKSVPLPI